MNPQVELNLAMILFLPWFLILAWAYWAYPRSPRDAARLLADAAALAVATLAAVLSTWWSIHNADPGAGAIWKQVLASTLSYGAFLGVLTATWFARRRWLRNRVTLTETPR